MKYISITLILTVAISTSLKAQQLADPILLWPEGAPGATGKANLDKPAIIPFVPDAAVRNGAAILVVPGGGFTIRAVDHEGVLVAQWLKDHGFTAFLLRYRLRPIYGREHWVADGEQAMRYIRAHAKEYTIDNHRVGAIGFSAGANLIADMAMNASPEDENAPDPLDHFSTRPDFLVLGYGHLRIAEEEDEDKIAKMPPTFFYCTAEDRFNTLSMLEMQSSLLRAGVPVESHFFQNGEHGSGMALGDPILGQWPMLMNNWLKVRGFLTVQKQVSLTGVIHLDGAPLVKGMLILTPVDNDNAPPAIVYLNNTGTGELGRFTIPADQGPVPGKYRVEVRQDATRWTSNSREPFMIEMMGKQRQDALSDQDIERWGEYIRNRDLSPSIYNQVVYSLQHPHDKKDYVLEVKEGMDVVIEVFGE